MQFFLINDENEPDCGEWVASFQDERTKCLGAPIGRGGFLWLEHGRLVMVEPYGGHFLTEQDILQRTMALWQKSEAKGGK